EPVAVARKQRLVGGNDRLAGGKRRFHRAPSGIAGTADDLDEDVDGGIGGERRRVGDPAEFLQINRALLAARAGADRDHLDRAAATRDQLVAPPLEEINYGRTDGPQ